MNRLNRINYKTFDTKNDKLTGANTLPLINAGILMEIDTTNSTVSMQLSLQYFN